MTKLLMMLVTLGLSYQASSGINTTYFRSLDIAALHQAEIQNARKGEAPRFAIPHQVKLDAKQSSHWEKSGQLQIWSHRVSAPNAVSLNFGFSKFHLPEGAELNIYSADHTKFIRPFTAADNNLHQELWTPVILSDDVIIELTVPAGKFQEVQLELSQVGQGFRTFGQSTAKSGACNVDVACRDSAGWEKEVNSVGVISTGGSRFCTGFMVNNTAQDRTPFFMTADHCRITANNAASLVVYWNYQTAQCKGPRNGKLTDFQTGSLHLASNRKSDFTLVKLLQAPKSEWNVTYAGWDATGAVGSAAVGIHHPNVDEKSISFENDPTTISSYAGNSSPGNGTHIRVEDWDIGTTEPGSSGSPLFDDQHRVIGQLHGGGAACGNDEPDWYGRFSTSWHGDGANNNRLKDHLDAANTGSLTVDTL